MSSLRFLGACTGLSLVGLGLVACGSSGESPRGPSTASQAPAVDVTADRGAAKQSWVVAVGRDPTELVKLAQSNPGWGKLFNSDTSSALADFRGPALQAGAPAEIELGAARAALELAVARAQLAGLTTNAWSRLGEVTGNTAGPEAVAWRACFEARALAAQGQPIAPAQKRLPPNAACASVVAALTPGDASPTAAWLKGQPPEGFVPPAGATPAWTTRLEVAAQIAGGQWLEAERGFAGLDAAAPDVVVGTGETALGLQDPGLAMLGAHVAAGLVVELTKDAGDWAAPVAARALLLLNQPAAARARLAPLLSKAPSAAPLGALVLTDALDTQDVVLEARALDALAQHRLGERAPAKAALEALPADTIAHRVLRGWALRQVGEKFDPTVLPDDRSLLAQTIADELKQLGSTAPGLADVAALNLVERFVDAVERRFAETADLAGEPERALKHLEGAEDKSHALAPSPRNQLSALMFAARVNVRMGRPRVALKYLSRAQDRLPAVTAPAELLRDLLTIQAMGQEGGAASGQ